MKYIIQLSTLVLWLCVIQLSFAQNSDEAKQVTDTYFISNATVVVSPSKAIENCDIIVRKGIISQVGKNLTQPWDAEYIGADSMYVYAAFICAASDSGYKKTESKKQEIDNPGNPPMALAGISPQNSIRKSFNSKGISDFKKHGFGYVHVVPKGQMLPGMGSILTTGSENFDKLILKENFAQYAQFTSASQRVFPSNILGVMASFRNVLKNAKNQLAYSKIYNQNPQGISRPGQKEEYTALYPVVSGKKKMFFKANKPKDILRAITLQKELDFPLVLTDVKYLSPILPKLGKQYPILLSVDLPKEKKLDSLAHSASAQSFENKRMQVYNSYLSQASILEKKGIPFAFSCIDSKPGDVKKSIERMMAQGLSEKAALAALTTHAAKILEIENIAGTIEKGKIANLMISDTAYFSSKSKIHYMLLDGVLEKKEVKETKNEADLSLYLGRWRYEVIYNGSAHGGDLDITKEGSEYTITLKSDEAPKVLSAKEISMDKKNLTFDLEATGGSHTMLLHYNLTMDKDEFSGTVDTQMGSFPITGQRSSPKY